MWNQNGLQHYYTPTDVFLKRMMYALGFNPIRIPSSFIIQQLA